MGVPLGQRHFIIVIIIIISTSISISISISLISEDPQRSASGSFIIIIIIIILVIIIIIIIIISISISLISEDPQGSASGSFIIIIIIIIVIVIVIVIVGKMYPRMPFSVVGMGVWGRFSAYPLCTLLPLHTFLSIFHPPTSFRPPCTQVLQVCKCLLTYFQTPLIEVPNTLDLGSWLDN